jgi:hypothetical protein
MSKIKIPKLIYVVSQDRPENEYIEDDSADGYHYVKTDHQLGFLHRHDPKLNADQNLKKTQHDWAYIDYSMYNVRYEETDEGFFIDYDERTWPHSEKPGVRSEFVMTHKREKIEDRLAPKVWVNEPLEGFEVIDTVSRYRGNKLYRIMDPRGIEFEVTTASIFQIMTEGTISKGVIQGPCIWKTNKNLILA